MGFARNRGQVRKSGKFSKKWLLCYLGHDFYLKIASPTHKMTQKGTKTKNVADLTSIFSARSPFRQYKVAGRAYPGKPFFLLLDGNENYYTDALILLVRTNCVVIFLAIKLKKNRFPRIRLPRDFRALSARVSVTLSVGTPLCPYGVGYRRVLGRIA